MVAPGFSHWCRKRKLSVQGVFLQHLSSPVLKLLVVQVLLVLSVPVLQPVLGPSGLRCLQLWLRRMICMIVLSQDCRPRMLSMSRLESPRTPHPDQGLSASSYASSMDASWLHSSVLPPYGHVIALERKPPGVGHTVDY